MAAAVASNPHRSATVMPRNLIVPLRCSSFRVRVSVNPACVATNPAEVMEGAVDKQEASAARREQHHRSRDEERPRMSPPARRRQRNEDGKLDASPDRKRGRDSVSRYRDVIRRSSSSSSRLSSAARSADAHRRDRDDAYRAAKKKQESDERDRARRNRTRRSVSGASRTRTHGAAVHEDRKPTPEKGETAEDDEAEVARRRDIERQREEARREIDRMVKTVEFNDPFISPMDVLKPRAH